MYFGQKTRHFLALLIAIAFIASAVTIADAKAPVVTHKITVNQSTGGTITPKKSGTYDYVVAKDNRDCPFTITPDKGYAVTSIVTDAGTLRAWPSRPAKVIHINSRRLLQITPLPRPLQRLHIP